MGVLTNKGRKAKAGPVGERAVQGPGVQRVGVPRGPVAQSPLEPALAPVRPPAEAAVALQAQGGPACFAGVLSARLPGSFPKAAATGRLKHGGSNQHTFVPFRF